MSLYWPAATERHDRHHPVILDVGILSGYGTFAEGGFPIYGRDSCP